MLREMSPQGYECIYEFGLITQYYLILWYYLRYFFTYAEARRDYSTYEKWDLTSAQQYIHGFVLSVKQYVSWGAVCPFSIESAVPGGGSTSLNILF